MGDVEQINPTTTCVFDPYEFGFCEHAPFFNPLDAKVTLVIGESTLTVPK